MDPSRIRAAKHLVMLGGLLVAPLVRADLVFETAPNLGVAISDDAYNGTLASMACVNIPTPGTTGSLVNGLAVTAWIDHTWIGDLVVKTVSPDNTVVTLMSRPGVAEATDDGTAAGGDSSNLGSAYPIEFIGSGSKNAELMGNTLSNTQVVCKDDFSCSYAPDRGAAPAGNLGNYIGKAMSGTWKFCVGDGGLGDVGTIQKVRLTFLNSSPGTLAISPGTLDFGSVVQGTTSAVRYVTLANSGNQDLSVNAISTALPPFQRTTDGTCGNSLPRVIPVGSQCTLSYAYAPSAQDTVSQLFTVQTNSGAGDAGFTLQGTGDAIFVDGFEL